MRSVTRLLLNIYSNRRLLLFFLFCSSILISLVFFLFFRNIGPVEHQNTGSDYSSCYVPMTESIVRGKDLSFSEKFFVRCAPGYPLFLVPLFYISDIIGVDKVTFIIFINIIIGAVSCALLFLIAELIFNRKVALFSFLLWASYPFNLWFIKNPNTEVLFILLFYLGILLYLRALRRGKNPLLVMFAVGLILGFNSLVRPINIGLILVLAIATFFMLDISSKKIKILICLAMLVGNLAAILPWEVYVFSRTGHIIPISSSGPVAIKLGFSFAASRLNKERIFGISQDVMGMMERIWEEKGGDDNEFMPVLSTLKKEGLREPFVFLKIVFLKIVRFWYGTDQMWWEREILAIQIPYLFMAIFGLFLATKFYISKIKYIIFLLMLVFYFWGITFVTFSIVRYSVPIAGFIMIFVAISINRLVEKYKIVDFVKRYAEAG